MRIVSLVPSHTESLHDLGLQDAVVGRTRFCVHPEPWVGSIPSVGGTKDAKLEKILALRPDLVVVDKDENPLALVEGLQGAGVEVLWSEIDSVQDAADFLRVLGGRCGVADAGQSAAAKIEEAVKAVQSVVPARPVAAFVPIWVDPWMTFNHTAYLHDVLQTVGVQNVFGDRDGDKYFEVEEEEVRASGARVALLPTEPFPFHKKPVDTSGLDVAAAHVIDGEALTWFGTHTAPGLRTLSRFVADLQPA